MFVWEPLRVGSLTLKGRLVRLPHGTGTLARGGYTTAWCDFHAQFARAGVPMTVLEACSVHPSCPNHLRIWSPRDVEGARPLVEVARREGMALVQQLWHAGHHVTPADRGPTWSPSGLSSPINPHPSMPMGEAQIAELTDSFAAAARACEAAGLDGVELNAGHGYLFHQFLSPFTNQREDGYGGDLDGRSRFLREVIDAVRAGVGPDFVVGVRLSLSAERDAPGFAGDVLGLGRRLDAEGAVDYLSVSVGSHSSRDEMIPGRLRSMDERRELTRRMTAAVDMPTILAGRVLRVSDAERILAEGGASLVGMARALIADPELLAKSRRGDAGAVRPCISCNESCIGAIESGSVGCTVNPDIPRVPGPLAQAGGAARKRIAVVGGGPAGMETAWRLAAGGADVTLLERSERLGGLLAGADGISGFAELGPYRDWLIATTEREGVRLRLDAPADWAALAGEDWDAVVLAAGGRDPGAVRQRGLPQVDLAAQTDVHHVSGLAQLRAARPEHVLVVDDRGDYVTAAAVCGLLDDAVRVSLVSPLDSPLPTLAPYFQRDDYERRLRDGARHWPRACVSALDGAAATISSLLTGEVAGRCDDVDAVLWVGQRLPHPVPDELGSMANRVHAVGEARGGAGIRQATRDADRTARAILAVAA